MRWRLYHFHNTSRNAHVKQVHGINDNKYLRDDAPNLAPFFGDFDLYSTGARKRYSTN